MDKYNKELFLHLILGLIALLITFLFGGDKQITYYVVISSYILLASLITWIKSKFASEEGQNLFISFLTDDFFPNKNHKFLDFKTEIVFVEYDSENSIYGKYKKELEKIEGLKVTRVFADSSKEIDFPTQFSGAESVIIVRSKELEKHPQIYDKIESWASKNSQVPCLVIDKIKPEDGKLLKLNPIPERYFFIPDDEKSLAWRLLQRANERSLLWRKQAGYNRFVAYVFVIILFIVLLIVGFEILSLKREKDNFADTKQVYKNIAQETKEYYEKTILREADPSLSFSYWMRYGNDLYRLGTSEENSSYKSLPNNKKSAVSCSFHHPNIFATNVTSGLSIRTSPIDSPQNWQDSDCEFMDEKSRYVNRIICASYNKETKATVSICIDTKKDTNLESNESLEFLRNRTKTFFEAISPKLLNEDIVP